MGAIAGVVRWDGGEVDPTLVEQMLDAVAHRGTNNSVVTVPGAAIGALGGGATQASALCDHDRATAVHADPSTVDRVAAALAQGPPFGESTGASLAGSFAGASWDGSARTLHLVADPIAGKPLVWSAVPEGVAFASDPRSVRAHPAVSGDLDPLAAAALAAIELDHLHRRTLIAGISRVEPGHEVVLSGGSATPRRWWDPAVGAAGGADRSSALSTADETRWTDLFRSALLDSVADALDDRPPGRVAVLLSGGIDSSAVLAIARHLVATGRCDAELVAITVGFTEHPECDERQFATAVTEPLGVPLHVVAAEGLGIVDEPLDCRPEPPTDPLRFACLAEAARLDCGVMLTGMGGDSLFDGARLAPVDAMRSRRLREMRAWVDGWKDDGLSPIRAWARMLRPALPPAVLDRMTQWRESPPAPGTPWLTAEGRSLLDANQASSNQHTARERQRHDILWLAHQQIDLGWFEAHGELLGVDLRHPLLDRRPAEVALAAPLAMGARPGLAGTKWMLREATRGLLPDLVRTRTSKGTWGPRNRAELCGAAHDLLDRLDPLALDRIGVVDDDALRAGIALACGPDAPYQLATRVRATLLAEVIVRHLQIDQ